MRCHWYVTVPSLCTTALDVTANVIVRPLPTTAAAAAGVAATFGMVNAEPSTHSVCGPPEPQLCFMLLFNTVRTRHS